MMNRLSIKHIVSSAGAKGRVVATLMIVATVVLGYASNALAQAAPPNDERLAATRFNTIGYTDSINTADATTAFDDPECVGQGPTVWYSFTPTDTVFIGANTFGSEYDTTLSAYVEEAGSLVQIACNDDAGFSVQSRVRFEAQQGVTYLFMVGSFASGPGGPMTFTLIEATAPVQIELAVDSRSTVHPRSGVATLSGTVTCTGQTTVFIDGSLRQRAGRVFIDGSGSTLVFCNDTSSWSLEVPSFNGRFAGGRADANVFAASFGEDFEENSFAFESATVNLVGSRR